MEVIQTYWKPSRGTTKSAIYVCNTFRVNLSHLNSFEDESGFLNHWSFNAMGWMTGIQRQGRDLPFCHHGPYRRQVPPSLLSDNNLGCNPEDRAVEV
jgi:hypothetical protein